MWSKKQKRCYHRIQSGLVKYNAQKLLIRFITLTSSPASTPHNISRDFQILTQRIRRKYSKFEYIKINTNEGHGVIHLLYNGSYIPQKWLSNQWSIIHKSPIVDVRAVRGSNQGLALSLIHI